MAHKLIPASFRKGYHAVKNPVFSMTETTQIISSDANVFAGSSNKIVSAGVLNRPKSRDPATSTISPTAPSKPKAAKQDHHVLIELTELNKNKDNIEISSINSKTNSNAKKENASLPSNVSDSGKVVHGKEVSRKPQYYLPKLENNNTSSNSVSKNLTSEQRRRERRKQRHKNDKADCYQFRNQEDFCEAVCEARVMNDYEELQNFLGKIYGSFSELVKVFKVEITAERKIHIDIDYLDYVHESVIRMPKDVQKLILHSIINCMLNDKKAEKTKDDLTAFLILLLNLQFSDSSTYVIFAHVLRQVAVLKNKDHHHLMNWFRLLPSKEYKNLIDRINKFVNYRLFPAKDDIPEGVLSDWWIPNAVKVLALLNAANEQTLPLLVPKNNFYLKGVELLDLVKEYQTWQSGSKKFSFCQYPFVLSLSAKRYILQKDSETKMLLEARQSLVNNVRQKQAPRMGMLFLNLNIRRKFILEDSLEEISKKQKDLRKKLRVIFKGEPGIDLGGVSKEWFFLIMQRFFNENYGMFKYNDKLHTWWFNSSSKDNYQEFNLCGVLMGLAMYNGINLDMRFPPCVYKKLLNPAIVPYNNPHAPVGIVPMGMYDFKEVYPDLAKGLQELLEYEGDVENDLCQSFQVSYTEFGQVITRMLKPEGHKIPVTNINKQEYVNLYVDYLLNRCIYQQFYSFYHGFHSVCASNALLLLRPEEVETLVIGNCEFNIKDLEKVTVYDGYAKFDSTIRYLWETVCEYPQKLQRKFLFFCTGSDRIPIGGMKEMKFKITKIGGRSAAQMLPMAHTCFNQLCLPSYKNRKTLQKKLSIAIENAEGFGLE